MPDAIEINRVHINKFNSTLASLTNFFLEHQNANPDEEIVNPDTIGPGETTKPDEGTGDTVQSDEGTGGSTQPGKDPDEDSKTSQYYKDKITERNGHYYTDKDTLDEICKIESDGVDFSKMERQLQSSRPSTEGGVGTSNVYKYSDSEGTRFIIHEVTDANGNIIHRDFDAVRVPSGQLILKE